MKEGKVGFYSSRGCPGGSESIDYSFLTLNKNCYETRNLYSATLKVGTDKQHIKKGKQFYMNVQEQLFQ